MALLNQMKLPSAIGVELKLVSIELEVVHAPSVTYAEATTGPLRFPLARDTAAKIAARDSTPSQARHLPRTPADFIDTLDNPDDELPGPRISIASPL
jgi:hypothetical protein